MNPWPTTPADIRATRGAESVVPQGWTRLARAERRKQIIGSIFTLLFGLVAIGLVFAVFVGWL